MLFSTNCASSHIFVSQHQVNIEKKSNRYVLNGVVDLNGQTLRLPPRIILDCREGVLKNGAVEGDGNRIIYDGPFIGDGLSISGCYVEETIIRSEEVLVNNNFSNQDVHNVFNIAKPGVKITYERGLYKDITPLNIVQSVNIDFSGSIIETAIDKYELSGSVFLTPVQPSKVIESVIIKNLTIDGKLPRYGIESGVGPRRNAIRLIGVKNVTLDSIVIINFRFGTSGYYAKDVKDRHMAGVCAIMKYNNCTIQNCSMSMCTGEGFYLVPNESRNNYTIFNKNKSVRNYGTFLTLVDGKCFVEDNEMEEFGLSGMNIFCYNSTIRNNRFKGGARFNCIDITENGLYWAKNVEISNNTADGCAGFIMVSGENITVSENKCINPASGFALTIYGYRESPEYLTQRNKIANQASVSVFNNEWVCKGGIATYMGCKGVLNITGNTITIVPDMSNEPHRGTALELNDCRRLVIEDNTFNDSFRNSITRSNVYITMNECRGEAVIRNNSFSRTRTTTDDTSYFLFTKGSILEKLVIENNTSNVKGIGARAVEGKLPVRKEKILRNNGDIITKGVTLE